MSPSLPVEAIRRLIDAVEALLDPADGGCCRSEHDRER